MPHDARARAAGSSTLAAAAVVVVLVCCLPLIAGGVVGGHDGGGATAAQATTTVPVDVGVILDLGTGLGKKSLLSLEMALEDFYAAHPAATTRVRLQIKDSERDVFTAAAAGIYTTAFNSLCDILRLALLLSNVRGSALALYSLRRPKS